MSQKRIVSRLLYLSESLIVAVRGGLADLPKNAPLNDAALSFWRSLQRIQRQASLPFEICWHQGDRARVERSESDRLHMQMDAWREEWIRRGRPPAGEYPSPMEERSGQPHKPLYRPDTDPPGMGHYIGEAFALDAMAIEIPHLREAVEAWATSLLVATWTTFEALSRDLWKAAVNARPRLGFAALGAEPLPTDDDDERERKRNLKFSIPAWLLDECGYDLTGRMALLLKKKWDFASKNEARDAYVKTFGKSESANLKTIFDDPALKHLCALRNVIVHNAGVADPEFTKLVEQHSELSLIQPGQPVPITTALCREFVEVGLASGVRLLKFVDTWMTTNPK